MVQLDLPRSSSGPSSRVSMVLTLAVIALLLVGGYGYVVWSMSMKSQMVDASQALPGRDAYSYDVPTEHAVNGAPIQAPFADGLETAYFGMGCFWGAERLFWQLDGVVSTAVGYQGGHTPYPTYEEVCSGRTGHTEAVLVVFDPAKISYSALLKSFFEEHDPTQGMRQGNDVGTQYRSAIYWTSEAQKATAERVAAEYGQRLDAANVGDVTTEIAAAPTFYYAETYHQQYLHKVPNGYCGLKGTGVSCPIPAANTPEG